MTEGKTSPRVHSRAGSIRYAAALAVLRESLQQLGDLIRLQVTEYDRLTSRAIDIRTALYAWQFATTAVNDSLNRLESAHAGFESLTPEVLGTIREVENNSNNESATST